MTTKILLLLLLFGTLSCEQRDIDIVRQIYDDTGINIKRYTLLEREDASAIGDYSESFYLKVDDSEFNNVILHIRSQMKEKPKWKEIQYGYKLELYEPNNNERKIYEVNISAKTINYIFIED